MLLSSYGNLKTRHPDWYVDLTLAEATYDSSKLKFKASPSPTRSSDMSYKGFTLLWKPILKHLSIVNLPVISLICMTVNFKLAWIHPCISIRVETVIKNLIFYYKGSRGSRTGQGGKLREGFDVKIGDNIKVVGELGIDRVVAVSCQDGIDLEPRFEETVKIEMLLYAGKVEVDRMRSDSPSVTGDRGTRLGDRSRMDDLQL